MRVLRIVALALSLVFYTACLPDVKKVKEDIMNSLDECKTSIEQKFCIVEYKDDGSFVFACQGGGGIYQCILSDDPTELDSGVMKCYPITLPSEEVPAEPEVEEGGV